MDLGLKGKVALVTGSSRGIGKAAAKLLGKQGVLVAVTYHTSHANAERTAIEICEAGGTAIVTALHLESQSSIREAVGATLARWGRIDILINNAVTNPSKSPTSDPDEIEWWQEAVRANIEGTYTVTRAVLPSMRLQKWGRIVNVSSALAVDGLAGFSWYTTAKAALHGMTRTLAKELGPSGILVNVVMPGLTRTEVPPIYMSARHQEQAAANLSIRRLPSAEEVAQIIVFLASDMNRVVTGEVIRASGG